jgi:hypothetical protein
VDALGGRDESHHRYGHALDQAQVVPGEVPVQEVVRRGEAGDAARAQSLELERHELSQGDCLRELELALVGLERKLVELGDVLEQALCAREPVAVDRFGPVTAVLRGRLPVVHGDRRGRLALALERELRGGEARGGGGMLEHGRVGGLEQVAHPLVERHARELVVQEVHQLFGVVGLELADRALLLGDSDAVLLDL